MFRTRTGEITVQAQAVTLLAKSLRPAARQVARPQDPETRYRQRYVDLFMNPEVREVFRRRTKIVSDHAALPRRARLPRGRDPGAAAALRRRVRAARSSPTTTRSTWTSTCASRNELYLKRLIVGGFERVYEFSRDFRNEGIDRSHNPEFTMLEVYQAYADYEDYMRLTEEMVSPARRSR